MRLFAVECAAGGAFDRGELSGSGGGSCSSVYAVFDPAESKRRLGIYTMLLEIEHARSLGMEHFYSGYATVESSCYDYKKQFEGLSYFDWAGEWRPMEEMAL